MTEEKKTKPLEGVEKPQRKPRAHVEEVITKALKDGTPQEIVTAPPELPKEEANGRMKELDEALWQLFYGEKDDGQEGA